MRQKSGKNAVKKRTAEIGKAIRLLGWMAVQERIRTAEDRAIFDKLSQEFMDGQKVREDESLKKHGITF